MAKEECCDLGQGSVMSSAANQSSDVRLLPTQHVAEAWFYRIAVIEFFAVIAVACVGALTYHALFVESAPLTPQYLVGSLILGSIFSLICLVGDHYDFTSENWGRRGVVRAIAGISLAFVFFLAISFLLKLADGYSRGTFLTQLALAVPCIAFTRASLIYWTERSIASRRILGSALVVLSMTSDNRSVELAQKLTETGGRIVLWHQVDEARLETQPAKEADLALLALCKECRQLRVEIVVIIFDAATQHHLARLLEATSEMPVSVQLLPVNLLPFMQGGRIVESGRLRLLEVNPRPSRIQREAKRAMDLAGALTALLILSPLMLAVAAAIKFESSGPVMFRQRRHGFNNEPIEVLKFRTMHVSDDKAFYQTMRNDRRVTKVGRLLRASSIDELPQLFNVIRGDMSLVGPRPHAVEHNNAFSDKIKLLNRRHIVKPGITGWAQVNGCRGATDTCEQMQKRIEYDLYYVDNQSLFLDLKILFMTIFTKRAFRNAY